MGRFGFIALRLAYTVPLFLGVTLAVFLLLQLTPGDPGRLMLGPRATDAQVAAFNSAHGYDRGVFVQFWYYLTEVLRGQLGTSNQTGVPVTTILAERGPATAFLIGAGVILTAVISVPAGVWAAARRDRPVDHGIRWASLVLLYLPSFWVGFMLIRFVAIPTGWFPVSGFGETLAEHLWSVILPAITLALALSAVLVRSIRSSAIEVLGADYVAAARSVGVKGSRLVRRHVLRNSLIPTVNILATQLGFLLFGVVLLEYTFDIPGLGTALVAAAGQKDLPVLMGITLVFAAAVLIINLVADIVTAMLDPRVRIQ